MASGSSDQVRSVAVERYVRPALLAGRKRFSVAVKDLMKDLRRQGFPAENYPQICTAIRTRRFLREQGLEIEGIDGPPKGLSPTVVVRYRVASFDPESKAEMPNLSSADIDEQLKETPAARAQRLMEGLRGLLKEEYEEYGGGEAFLRWIRSEDDAPPTPGPVR